MLERIVITILIPALLMLTSPFLQSQNGQSAAGAGQRPTVESQAKALLQSILLGTQKDENNLIVLTRKAPDEVVAGETFTVTEEIRAKVKIEGAAIVASLPQGLALASGDLRGFVGATEAGGLFTHTYEVKAPELPGVYVISAIARIKPVDANSVSLSAKGLSVTVVEPNQPPVALFVPSPLNASTLVGETVVFNGTTSFDLDGTIAEYQWDLGDGTAPKGADRAIVEHAYAQPGNYRVSLVVVDGEGKASLPKFQSVIVTQPEEPEQPKLDQRVLIGGAVVVAAGVGYLIWKLINSGDSSAELPQAQAASSTAATSAAAQPAQIAVVQSESLASKAEDFIRSMRLPLDGVESVSPKASVTEASRSQWIDTLEDESLVILYEKSDVLVFKTYPDLSPDEQVTVDESLRPLGASSVRELLGKRVVAGDSIVQITWVQANGETFKSLAVVSPSGIIKFDTFMTLDP